jgi:hypothetical protein
VTKAIGGFFELETGRAHGSYHPEALALTSGRACLRRILEVARPRRVWAPYFICDAALAPMQRLGIDVTFYPLSETFEPQLVGTLRDDDVVLVVDYFGLNTAAVLDIASRHPMRTIVDDTQAFFRRGRTGAWSFNSARKFFGVPDGAYAYGRGLDSRSHERRSDVRYQHLVSRLMGDLTVAYEQYRASEACVSDRPVGMSLLAERLMSAVDYDDVARVRRLNFERLHERLGRHNRLTPELGDAVPFCYPFLAERPLRHEELWKRQVFVPVLWPEVLARGDERFLWEHTLADQLLPLPVDHRYAADDVDRLCDILDQAFEW